MVVVMMTRTRLCIASAAPITDETINFFASYDFPIYDLLGQSEGTAPICMNSHVDQQWKVRLIVNRECDVDCLFDLLNVLLLHLLLLLN